MKRYVTVLLILLPASLLASCIPASNPTPVRSTQAPLTPTQTFVPSAATPVRAGAFASGQYRNLFKEMLNKSDADIQAKLDAAWKQLFYARALLTNPALLIADEPVSDDVLVKCHMYATSSPYF